MMVSNIPYYITSDILFKIFRNVELFSKAVLMVQEEVAKRLCAKVGSKDYGKLTIVTQYFSNAHIALNVPAASFTPVPKVNSAVVVFEFKETVFNKIEEEEFLLFVKHCFAMRRKKLSNNLKKIDIFLTEKNMIALDLNVNSRPQELTLKQYLELFNITKLQT